MEKIALTTIDRIYSKQLFVLIDEAYQVHKQHFADDIELCHLISVKTGGCPEDCKYCAQSNSYETKITTNPLLSIEEVEQRVKAAKTHGVKRICLGAAYKTPQQSALNKICQYVAVIKQHGLEACATLGSLDIQQAEQLKSAGLDYYNHNIDTSPEYYAQVITTRTFQERLDTIKCVGGAGIKICCGGILGMGESRDDRLKFIKALTNLAYTPDSIPINLLVKIPGTPLANVDDLDKFELLRTIATIRILFPQTRIRLSAGRTKLSELEQATCFMAGANSIHYGDKLLVTTNNDKQQDLTLLDKLGQQAH